MADVRRETASAVPPVTGVVTRRMRRQAEGLAEGEEGAKRKTGRVLTREGGGRERSQDTGSAAPAVHVNEEEPMDTDKVGALLLYMYIIM